MALTQTLYNAPIADSTPAIPQETIMNILLADEAFKNVFLSKIHHMPRIPLAGRKVLVEEYLRNVTRAYAAPTSADEAMSSNTSNKYRLTEIDVKPKMLAVRQIQNFANIMMMSWFSTEWNNGRFADVAANPEFRTRLLNANMEAMRLDFFRFLFLGDKAAAASGSGGYVVVGTGTDGNATTVADWNQTDGWFTLAKAGVAGGTIKRVNMDTQNKQLTSALQYSTMTPAAMRAYLDEAIKVAPVRLTAPTTDPNNQPTFFCTYNVAKVLAQGYVDQAYSNMTDFQYVQRGPNMSLLQYRGYDIFPVAALDEMIALDTKSIEVGATTATHMPWQFMFARPKSLVLGEVENPKLNADVLFNPETDNTILKAAYAIDMHLVNHSEIVMAY